MKSFAGILANQYYHKENDKLESVQEVGLMLGDVKYVSDGKSVAKSFEVETLRFMLTKGNADDIIKFLSSLNYEEGNI